MKHLLLLDYDGTLTPIVNRPELARLSSRRKKILKLLARHPQIKMAIISGRKLSDIKKLVGIPHLIYAGNHGFEIEIHGKHFVFPAAQQFAPVLKKIKSEMARKIKVKGVLIEDKKFTLSIHYRLVAGHDLSLFHRLFNEVIRPWKGKVKVTKGKKVFEIRPPFDWDKGKAVKWIMKKLGLRKHLPIYIGDDQTDEDAFKVLKGKGISIWVGREKSPRADYHLRHPGEVYSFFGNLLKGGKYDCKYLAGIL